MRLRVLSRLRRPRFTIRVRLTLMYGALVLATGTALLVVINLLQVRSANSAVEIAKATLARPPSTRVLCAATSHATTCSAASASDLPRKPLLLPQVAKVGRAVSFVRDDTLHHLLLVSAISIGALAIIAVVVGWWLAGRMLRPLRRITATARRLSRDNLSERVELHGPDDELRDLSRTFNDMLTRLESSFDSQERFVFNASHELRTPLALQRAAIEIGLGSFQDPDIGRVREDLLGANRRIERLIDGLLLLAQGDRGLDHSEPVALHALAADVIDQYQSPAAVADVRLERSLEPFTVRGDAVLLAHLVRNLVHNAVTYNVPGGVVEVITSPDVGLLVRNTGPRIPADRVEELFEPFRRLGAPRTRTARSSGLGLSIVRSITAAHGGEVTAVPHDGGGLEVRVRLDVSAQPVAAASR